MTDFALNPLQTFLAYLEKDGGQAGERYEGLRRALIRYFEMRQVMAAEELADVVLDRVSKKIVEGEPVKDIGSYCLGVARFVHLEWLRNPGRNQVTLDELGQQMPVQLCSEDESARIDCMTRCFWALSDEKRGFLRYYFDGKGRKRTKRREVLAVQLGINQAALYNRIKRLLDQLRDCKADCLREALAR